MQKRLIAANYSVCYYSSTAFAFIVASFSMSNVFVETSFLDKLT